MDAQRNEKDRSSSSEIDNPIEVRVKGHPLQKETKQKEDLISNVNVADMPAQVRVKQEVVDEGKSENMEDCPVEHIVVKPDIDMINIHDDYLNVKIEGWQCSICGTHYSQKAFLEKHMIECIVKRPHKCNVCEKGFSSINMRLKHERIHTGEKPYECSYCGECFTWRNSLVSHEKIHIEDVPPPRSTKIKERKGEKLYKEKMKAYFAAEFHIDTEENEMLD